MKKKMLLVAAVCFSSLAQAQNDSTSKALDEIIVTANRMEQKQSQTGKVVSVIGKSLLEKSHGKTVAQVLNEQAGITINGALNNAGSVQTVYMRGGASGRVLVLLDGVPVGDPSFINNEFDLNFFSINDVERIEIARGAQSTLYGSDAIAGVINIITTKKNVIRPVHIKSTMSAGNYQSLRGNVQVYGKAGKLSYQTRFTTVYTGGFSAAHDSSGNKGFDKDGYNGTSSNAAVQYQATKELYLRSFVQYSKYTSDVDGGVFTDDRDFTINNRTFMTGAGFQFKKEGVSVTGNYQYSEHKRSFLNDSNYISGFSKYIRDDYFSKSQFAELFATIKISPVVTLLQGGDFRYGSYNNQYLSVSSFGPFATRFNDTSISQSSLYASFIYASRNKKLNIELGGRLNVHSRYGSNYTYTFNPTYRITDNIRVFGNIATGFKAPGLYQLYSAFGNRNLNPEESINYELGLEQKKSSFKHRLVWFYRETDNGMDFDNVNFRYFNFPRQLVRGLEYEISFQIMKQLYVAGNYTYLNGTEFSQSRITFRDTAYQYLLRRPAHQFNITASYQSGKKLFFSVSGKFTGNRFDFGGYAVKDAPLHSYFLLNVYAEYKHRDWLRLFADAQNLTQTQFFDLRGFNSIPRLLTVGCTLEW